MFQWAPITEVAKLFIAIFITIEPVIGLLNAGLSGPAAPLLRLTLAADGTPGLIDARLALGPCAP